MKKTVLVLAAFTVLAALSVLSQVGSADVSPTQTVTCDCDGGGSGDS